MKKIVISALIIMLSAGVFSVSAEDAFPIPPGMLEEVVGEIGEDFGLLLDGVGSDIDTILLQNTLSGQNVGMAELGDGAFSTFYIGLPAISVTASNGFLTFRNDDNYFQRIDLNTMLNDLVLDSLYEVAGTANEDFVDFLLDEATPFPSIKLNGGFKLPGNLELLLSGMWIPGALVEMIPGVSDLGLSMSYVNVGGVLRYVVLRDGKGTPGMSVGFGGYYNNVKLGLDLTDLLEEQFSTGDDTFENAGLDLGVNMLALGVEVSISKKLIGFFVPYLKVGAWYGMSDIGGEVVLMDGVNVTSAAGGSDMAFLLDTGFDIALGPFIMNLGGNYNIGSGVWGIELGSRLQF